MHPSNVTFSGKYKRGSEDGCKNMQRQGKLKVKGQVGDYPESLSRTLRTLYLKGGGKVHLQIPVKATYLKIAPGYFSTLTDYQRHEC